VRQGEIAATRQSAAKMQYGRESRTAGLSALIQQLIPEDGFRKTGSVSTGSAAASAWTAAAATGTTTATTTARGAILGFIDAQRASAH
jgi:hypothetical protein